MSYDEGKYCVCGEPVLVDYADGMCTICCIKKLKAKIKDLEAEMDKWNMTTAMIEKDLTFEAENKRLKKLLKKSQIMLFDIGGSPLALAAHYGPDFEPPSQETTVEWWNEIAQALKDCQNAVK